MEKYSDDSQVGLLDQQSDFSGDDRYQRPAHSWLRTNALSLAILSLLVYIASLLTVNAVLTKTPVRGSRPPKEPYSKTPSHFRIFDVVADRGVALTRDAVRYEQRPEWGHPQHPWNLEPSEELATAWHDLISGECPAVRHHRIVLLADTINSAQPQIYRGRVRCCLRVFVVLSFVLCWGFRWCF